MGNAAYENGQPNIGYWRQQIREGIKYRDKYTHKSEWDNWRNYYRGSWQPGVLPVNLFYMMVRTMVPRVYFRNPSVSITPTKPGPENAAFALILQRVDGKLLRQMKLKQQMKRLVHNTFFFGTAALKLGFGGLFTPTPELQGFTTAPLGQGTSKTLERWSPEYRTGIRANMPWIANVHPGQLVYPAMLVEEDESPWVAHIIRRPVLDVKHDSRFKNVDKLVGKGIGVEVPKPGEPTSIEMVDLIELRDIQTGNVIVFPLNEGDKHLFMGEDKLQYDRRAPIYANIFNMDDEVFWGVPDSVILTPHQLEANEIRTQMMKHRRLSILKIIYENDAISEAELDKLLSEDVGAGIQVSDVNKITNFQLAEIPKDLFAADATIRQDVREVFGFSRNQIGEFNQRGGDTTATEATIVKLASEIRIDERRDILADLLVDVVTGMHRIIFSQWTETQVIDVVGPQGAPIFVEFSGRDLAAGEYDIKVDPDTSLPETKELRSQRAVKIFALLKDNPLIDPQALTQYLLHEHHGVEFDALMQRMDLAGGGTQQKPLALQDFTRLIEQSRGNPPSFPPVNGNQPGPPAAPGGKGAPIPG